MNIEKKLPNIGRITIVVPPDVKGRLKQSCFRGKAVRLSGNFHRWGSIGEMLQDAYVMEEFLADVADAIRLKTPQNSVRIDYDFPVGWEGTAPRHNFSPGDLEPYKPNARSCGLRVKPTRINLFAPRTDFLTIVYSFRLKRGRPLIIIHSAYPGEDVGELDGDVTAREGRVFFDQNHPGAL